MSKLLKKYEELKLDDPNKLYLFKSGIFYLSLNDDARRLSELFGFKITNLNETTIKCGFPIKKLNFYSKLLTTCSVDFLIIDSEIGKVNNYVDYSNNQTVKGIIKSISDLDMNQISFKQAFDLLLKFNEQIKQLQTKGEL